jgi:hypothetical protein
MIDLTEIDQLYSERLKRIPKQMPEEFKKNRPQRDLVTTSNGHICRPDCPICSGWGFYRLDLDDIHDPRFGKLVKCPNLDPFKTPYADRLGITGDEARDLAWDSLLRFGDVIGLKAAREAVQETMQRGYGWVFLHGTFGIGKSLLLKIVVAEAMRAGNEAAYVRMAEILDHLRASFDDGSTESESKRMDWWTDLPVLAIDEFDKVRATAYGKERSFVLMDRRYEQAVRQKSVTIIASNDPPQLFDGYLYDRIRDGRFAVREITGESRRPGMRWSEAIPA